ncbi:cysteine proteinase, partial [Ramicandelaber brevisporus]
TTTTTPMTASTASATAQPALVIADQQPQQQQQQQPQSDATTSVTEPPKKPFSWADRLKTSQTPGISNAGSPASIVVHVDPNTRRRHVAEGSDSAPLSASIASLALASSSSSSSSVSLVGGNISTISSRSSPAQLVAARNIAQSLRQYSVDNKLRPLQPRGLENSGNMCFVNPLIHCAPFANLLSKLGNVLGSSMSKSTPLLEAMLSFHGEFRYTEDLAYEDALGDSLIPEVVYDTLRSRTRFESIRGRQEDTQEFLGFLLDGLHEEMIGLIKDGDLAQQTLDKASTIGTYGSNSNPTVSAKGKANGDASNDTEEWLQQTGKRGKAVLTRQVHLRETPVSQLFGGTLRSVLKRTDSSGGKPSVNVEPFLTLQLDISAPDVETIEEALVAISNIDQIEGAAPGSIIATKQLFVDQLPPVLVLHVKRFVFSAELGVEKLSKRIKYGHTLHIPTDCLTTHSAASAGGYQLVGVVYHHGAVAAAGHYTCDVMTNGRTWLHFDDTEVTPVHRDDVVSDESAESAYLLFYVRDSSLTQSPKNAATALGGKPAWNQVKSRRQN